MGPQLLFIALVIGMPFGVSTAPSIFRDGDVSWQVAAGQWILHHGTIPTTDPFSFTAAGHPWVATEWLAEIIYASAFQFAGYAGLATVVAAALIATFAIVFFYLQGRASPFVLCAALLMMTFVLAPSAMARPHVLAFPLLAAWTILLLKGSETGRPPPIWSVLILVVWTNLHASFPLAFPIAGAIALDTLIEKKWAMLREWVAFGIASVVGAMLNANGVAGLLQPFKITSLHMLQFIGEWHPSSPQSMPFFFAVLLIGLGLLLRSGIRVPIGRLLLLLVMLGMAFVHNRHDATFAIVAICVLPPLWRSRPADVPVPKWLLAGALPLLAFRILTPLLPPESAANPRHLLAAIPPELRSRPVFNEYTFGGPLILAGVKPYIDGRAEMYGDEFVTNYMNIADGDVPAFNRTIEKYGIQWVMLQAEQKRLIAGIEASGEWRRVYSDKTGIIDVRLAKNSAKPT